MVDKGGNKYDLDESKMKVLEIDNRPIDEVDGVIVYADTKERVPYFD